MTTFEQVQRLSDVQLEQLCHEYNIDARQMSFMGRLRMVMRLHVAILSQRARRRAQDAFEFQPDDLLMHGWPSRKSYTDAQRWAALRGPEVRRHSGGDELHKSRWEQKEALEVRQHQEQEFGFEYEQRQLLQEQQLQQLRTQQQLQQLQAQQQQMQQLQLQQQISLQQLEERQFHILQQQSEYCEGLGQSWSDDDAEEPMSEDSQLAILVPQSTMINLIENKSSDSGTKYLTPRSSYCESEIRTVNFLTKKQIQQMRHEKQQLLDKNDGQLSSDFSQMNLLKDMDNVGDGPAKRLISFGRRAGLRGLLRHVINGLRFTATQKLHVHKMRYTILCCALAVCTYLSVKMLK